MSSLASQVLPYLAENHEITYVTAGDTIPQTHFRQVIVGKRWKYMNIAGFELSHYVNKLYRNGLIDIALIWASIGFGLRRVPFINLNGGSVYAEILLFGSQVPFHKRIRFLPGFLHYAVPEIVCNRRARKVIVPSNGLKCDVMRLHSLRENKVIVVPHGVEAGHMALYHQKAPDMPPRILFIGRLHFQKGIAAVIREFVGRKDIGAQFLIVGDGPDRAEMEKSAAEDERVRFCGHVGRKELESILGTTNIFIFPTFYEGFGLALVEAMASGHACVCYDIPVTREVLEDAGVYIPVGNAIALVDRVAELVRHPEKITALSGRAHERARKFSWEDAATSIDRIIRDTVVEYRNGRRE